MKYSQCQFPERRLWTYKVHPGFEVIETGNWISLMKCPQCRQFWCEVPHEPYASFPFWTAWPYSKEEWKRLNSIENALILHEWHTNVLREDFDGLPEDEKGAVETWRDRTYRHYNAIDKNPEFKYCSSSEEVEKHIRK